jgi:hypothetical protein
MCTHQRKQSQSGCGCSGYLSNISSDKRIRTDSGSSAYQQDDYNKENIGAGTGHEKVSCTHIL